MAEMSIVPGEALSHRTGRALIGWLSEAEAINLLLGGRSPPPEAQERP
jgi:hypothetical protein